MAARWGSRGFLGLSTGWTELEPTGEYDWSQWTDGAMWELRHRQDFHIPPEEMRTIIEAKGEELKRRVKVWVLAAETPPKLRFVFELDRWSRAFKSAAGDVGWGVFGGT